MKLENEDEFLETSEDNVVKPLRYKLEDHKLDPIEAYEALRDYETTGNTFLLESAETETSKIKEVKNGAPLSGRGKYSVIGFNPLAAVRVGDKNSIEYFSSSENHSILDFGYTVQNGELKEGYDQLDALQDVTPDLEVEDEGDKNRPNFTGGLVGFHPYDIVYDIKPLKTEGPSTESLFVLADKYLEYNHKEDTLEVVYTPFPSENYSTIEQIEEIKEEIKEIEQILDQPRTTSFSDSIEVITEDLEDRKKYENLVKDVKEDILNGEIYQGVISRKKDVDIKGDPLKIYSQLREENPSPYMYILEFGDKGILGASPETLVSTHGENGSEIVKTNPIAGTRPRGSSPDKDRKLMGELLADDKERAEHNMLVDLGRNDIRRVSEQGSVNVEDYMSVVQYNNVQHLESIVSGELSDEKNRFDAMRSVFPAGTLTGAPKVRAMEIISDKENSPRGIYGGAVGYYSLNNDSNFAIAIRSMEFEGDETLEGTVQAGAGIVQDSLPSSEFEETEAKMSSLTQILDQLGGTEK